MHCHRKEIRLIILPLEEEEKLDIAVFATTFSKCSPPHVAGGSIAFIMLGNQPKRMSFHKKTDRNVTMGENERERDLTKETEDIKEEG